MRDTRKEPLPGLCPRPQDFRRHISGVRWPAMKTAPDNYHRQRPDASSAHRRPGYPSSGCVPAEPDSVSPGNHTLAPMSTSCKKPSAPEPCLKNPIAPGNGRRAGQKKAEKSKITHTIWRRPFYHKHPHSACYLTTKSPLGCPRTRDLGKALVLVLHCRLLSLPYSFVLQWTHSRRIKYGSQQRRSRRCFHPPEQGRPRQLYRSRQAFRILVQPTGKRLCV